MNTSFKKLVKELNEGIDERKELDRLRDSISAKVNENANEALEECENALHLAEEINSREHIAHFTHIMGNCYSALSDYDKAIELILNAIDMYNERGDSNSLVSCYLNLGNTYICKKDYKKALKCFTESYRHNSKDNSLLVKARLLNNFGVIYLNTENYKKALKYFLDCIKIAKEIDDVFDLQSCYINIGLIYKIHKDYKKTLEYYNSALDILSKLKDKQREGYIYHYFADVHFEMKEYEKAIEYADMSLNLFEQIGSKSNEAINYVFKGKAYKELGNYDEALINCNLGLLIANQLNDESAIAETKFILAELYYNNGNIDKSINLAYDSILFASNKKMNHLLYSNYEFLSKVFFAKEDYKTSLDYKTKQFDKYKEMQQTEIDKVANNLILQFEIEKLDYETGKLKEEKGKLTQLNEKLEKLNKEKNEFIGILAHDLRNPLSAIYSLSEIYLDGSENLDDDQKEIMGEIKISSDKMLNLISNLLNLNAIESGKLEGNFSEINLNELTSQIIRENINSAKVKNISINVSKPHYEIKFTSHKTAVDQIITNILSNAVKYTFPNQNIFVGVYLNAENQPVCEIIDEGPGFTDKDKEKMFEKFAKLSAQPIAGEMSVGLGLSIVKKLADLIETEIEVNSSPGKGAKFVITFKDLI